MRIILYIHLVLKQKKNASFYSNQQFHTYIKNVFLSLEIITSRILKSKLKNFSTKEDTGIMNLLHEIHIFKSIFGTIH